MNIYLGLGLLVIFGYTIGFSSSLWKEKTKFGACTVFFLVLNIAVLPFFTIFNK